MPDAYRQPSALFPQPPDSTPDFALLSARRTRRIAIGLGAALFVLAAGAAGAILFSTRAARKEALAAATELRACVLRAPLAAGETPSARFRRLQLEAMSVGEAERAASSAQLWPLSCHAAAGRAADVLKASATEAEAKSFGELSKALDTPAALSADLTETIDAAFGALDRLAPGPAPTASEPLPPAPLTADDLASVPPLSREGTSLGHAFTEDNPGPSLPVLIDEKDLPAGPLLCTFGADRAAACRALSELRSAQQHGLRLLGTSDADTPALIFAGQRGTEGIFVSGSGTYVDRLYSYGGYSQKSGAVAILGWDEKAKKLVLSRRASDGPAVRLTLSPNFRVGNYFYGSQILWDQVLVRGVTSANERRLFVLPLAEADKRTFELADVGELPEPGLIREGEEEQPHITGCRTENATVVRVRGNGSDFLTFRIDGRFSKPVPAPTHGLLGCHGTSATVVRVEHDRGAAPLLYHDLCTSAGCTRAALKRDDLDRGTIDLRALDGARIAAVDVDGKLLVVWSAGERGGLRMRMAAPGAFSRARDVVLLDDHVRGGKVTRESTLLGFRLFSREHFAVLLVSTVSGLHALRIDASGKVEPWGVR